MERHSLDRYVHLEEQHRTSRNAITVTLCDYSFPSGLGMGLL
jgi:hypothetical protein